MNKATLGQLERIYEKVEERIDSRENQFYEKTDKWQESEKGELFQQKTEELQEVLYNLEAVIDSLNTFLES